MWNECGYDCTSSSRISYVRRKRENWISHNWKMISMNFKIWEIILKFIQIRYVCFNYFTIRIIP